MATTTKLEENLNDLFTKKLPPLPKGGKEVLVRWAPWLTLVGGVLTAWAAYTLWHWAHVANALVDYANSISTAYGGEAIATSRMTLGIWLGVGVLTLEAVLYLMAFSGLRDHKKAGWNLLFYALLVNVAYGVVVMFTDYGSFGNFVGTLLGSAIGGYFLFQIRGSYVGDKRPATVTPVVTPKA